MVFTSKKTGNKQVTKRLKLAECAAQDFEHGVILGTGSFGRVAIAKHIKSGQVVAIKALSKANLVKNGQVEHLVAEKCILDMINHNFLINLVGSYQDQECVYLVMEYVPGGEFFTHLRSRGRLTEETAKIYAAEVVCAFDYLHSQKIVYRDLKPENMLVDQRGHIKITDFGFAKIVQSRTFTLCGTPDYLAPEIILNKGHGKAVDWWALGVLIYEMVAGTPPFYDDDPMKTYKKIILGKFDMHKHFSPNLRDILRSLLQTDLTRRIGNLAGGTNDVKQHQWFKGMDWKQIAQAPRAGPIVPKVKGKADTSNFDDYSDLPPIEHEITLTQEQQKLFDGI